MSLIFTSTRPISFDEILGNWVGRYDIKITIAGTQEAFIYLYFHDTVLRVISDENGNCIFVVPDNGRMPWFIFDALGHHFDCHVERLVDSRGRAVSSFVNQAMMDLIGDDHLEPSDKLLRYVRGESVAIEPGTKLMGMATIAKALADANPLLREDRNSDVLLNIVEDIYRHRHPPFRATLSSKSPTVAKLLADSMLAWADGEDA